MVGADASLVPRDTVTVVELHQVRHERFTAIHARHGLGLVDHLAETIGGHAIRTLHAGGLALPECRERLLLVAMVAGSHSSARSDAAIMARTRGRMYIDMPLKMRFGWRRGSNQDIGSDLVDIVRKVM